MENFRGEKNAHRHGFQKQKQIYSYQTKTK